MTVMQSILFLKAAYSYILDEDDHLLREIFGLKVNDLVYTDLTKAGIQWRRFE